MTENEIICGDCLEVMKELLEKKTIRCPYCKGRVVKKRRKYRCENCYNKFTSEEINAVVLKREFNKKLREKYNQFIEKGVMLKCPNCRRKLKWSRFRNYYLSDNKTCSKKKCPQKAAQNRLIEQKQAIRINMELRNIRAVIKAIK